MRELMRSLLSANLFVTGILMLLGSIAVFYGTVYILNYTNLGKKLGFLVTLAGVSGWLSIGSLLFVVYAPRGPRPAEIEGLNAFQLRVVPLTYLLVSVVVFIGSLVALHQYEQTQERADL